MVTVLVVLGVALAFFLGGWLRVDLVAVLVLLALAMTGLVTAGEAVEGFSNPAVITVVGIYILSSGLYRTGVANLIGKQIWRLAASGEARMVVVIMLTAGMMSFFMNTVGIVALMLAVVMDISRRTGYAPSRLLMPLSYGALLGGLTTLFATLTNLLASNALREAGFEPFGIFDFAPVGGIAALAGIGFMATVGRRLLPVRDLERETAGQMQQRLREHYALGERMFVLKVLRRSVLEGRTLEQSRLGSALGLHVIAVVRGGKSRLAPGPQTVLRAADRLLVQGTPEKLDELASWRALVISDEEPGIGNWFAEEISFAEVVVGGDSSFVGQTLPWINFRQRFDASVLAIRRGSTVRRSNLGDWLLQPGDSLLVHGTAEKVEALGKMSGLEGYRRISRAELGTVYMLHERLFSLRISEESHLAGKTLSESRLGNALGITIVGLNRGGQVNPLPERGEKIESGDELLAVGRVEDLQVLQGLKDLELERDVSLELSQLESEQEGFAEAVLSPRATVAGKTLRQVQFRERYGVTILGVLREGQALSANLRDVVLQHGDGLLLYGPRDRLKMLSREADFVLLTEALQERPQFEKAPLAVLAMAVFLIPAMAGWLPLHIAAILGAAVIVLTGCLKMEEVYNAVDWKAVVLIAGMLPLGTAMESSGTAAYAGRWIVEQVGPLGPRALIGGLFVLTSVGTCFMPAAAWVVLMAPIALSAAADLGMSPHAVMMALALAAAASFNSPISHPGNIMIMGPGGYRFGDYLKVGIPLTLIILVVVVVVLPVFWPLK